MSFSDFDRLMMRRALGLAAHGRGHVSPNPMVGAVICAPGGRIIGEGWHRHYGGPHAEVWAVRSVSESDRSLLPESTIYVTLEPCSHYGKTPPCARLLVETGFRRVVVGAKDPNPRVAGRGIAMLRDAGIEVDTGLLEQESLALNKAFITAQTQRRPYVMLKWAQSADGFMAADSPRAVFSTPLGLQQVHALRASYDAIAVGAQTVLSDNPMLDVRHYEGPSPRPVVFDRRKMVDDSHRLFADSRRGIHISDGADIAAALHHLFEEDGVSSLLVEGGASLLQSFIDSGLWDEARVDVSAVRLGSEGRTAAPCIGGVPDSVGTETGNRVFRYSHR